MKCNTSMATLNEYSFLLSHRWHCTALFSVTVTRALFLSLLLFTKFRERNYTVTLNQQLSSFMALALKTVFS